MKPGCAPVGVGIALLAAAALTLTGCGGAAQAGGFDDGVSSCYGPMICGGAGYIMPVYVNLYMGYMRDPVHYSVNIVNGRTTTVYRPPAYSPPRPAPAPAAKAPAPAAPRPAAPRPPAPKAGKK